jgi:hypothetical protein
MPIPSYGQALPVIVLQFLRAATVRTIARWRTGKWPADTRACGCSAGTNLPWRTALSTCPVVTYRDTVLTVHRLGSAVVKACPGLTHKITVRTPLMQGMRQGHNQQPPTQLAVYLDATATAGQVPRGEAVHYHCHTGKRRWRQGQVVRAPLVWVVVGRERVSIPCCPLTATNTPVILTGATAPPLPRCSLNRAISSISQPAAEVELNLPCDAAGERTALERNMTQPAAGTTHRVCLQPSTHRHPRTPMCMPESGCLCSSTGCTGADSCMAQSTAKADSECVLYPTPQAPCA